MHSSALKHLSKSDPHLGRLIKKIGLCRLELPARFQPFESLARSIAHQQLNGRAAQTIWGRFVDNFGERKKPDPQKVHKAKIEALRAVGFSNAKSLAVKDLAEKYLAGAIPNPRQLQKMSNEEIIETLTQVRGIGQWTVEMLLIFSLGRLDVLPISDFGVRKGFSQWYKIDPMVTPKNLYSFGEKWAPYRSIASWYLWRATEL